MIINRDALVSYWPIFFPLLNNSPRSILQRLTLPGFLLVFIRLVIGIIVNKLAHIRVGKSFLPGIVKQLKNSQQQAILLTLAYSYSNATFTRVT